jgi:glutathione S-transferase
MYNAPQQIRPEKIQCSSTGPRARKVMVAAHELGLESRIGKVPIVVGMSKPNASLIPFNPLSRIPTLVRDDGTVLTDSLVICEYLDGLAGGHRLIPTAPAERIEVLRRHALGSGLLEIAVLARNERDRPDGARSQPHLAAYAIKIEAALDHFEKEADATSSQPFDIGQIALACALGYLDFRFGDAPWRPAHPALARWYETIAARPSMLATQHIDG